jgi:hypothetical protein
VNQIQDDVERPGEDEREEQTESGQIRITLGTVIVSELVWFYDADKRSLEFPCGNVGLCPDIRRAFVAFSELSLSGDTEHALKGVQE